MTAADGSELALPPLSDIACLELGTGKPPVITEFQIPAGKVCLSPMIDCFDGRVVSWSICTRPNAELVNTMLDAAIDIYMARQHLVG